MTTVTPPAEPVLFVLWTRSPGARRWTKTGRFGTRAEALAHCRGAGDFHIAPLSDPRLTGEATRAETTGQARSSD